jgi:hypothetical protein
MKRLLLAFFCFLSLSCFAQEPPKTPTPLQPSFIQPFLGYIIKVNAQIEGRFGYEILHEGRIVITQHHNPVTLSAKGLTNKEDVLKIARWQVQQLAAGTAAADLANQPVPPDVARRLNITLE